MYTNSHDFIERFLSFAENNCPVLGITLQENSLHFSTDFESVGSLSDVKATVMQREDVP